MADLYRYTGGGLHRTNGDYVQQGDTFKPSERELATKGRRLTKVTRSRAVRGADIGLRSLEWGSKAALRKAHKADLTVEEMEAIGPSGATGYITEDVDAALAARGDTDG